MKTIKILFISFLAIVFMSFSCEAEEVEAQTECDCITTYYTLPVGSSTYQWFTTDYDNDNLLDCDDETNGIIPVGGASTMFYKIECE